MFVLGSSSFLFIVLFNLTKTPYSWKVWFDHSASVHWHFHVPGIILTTGNRETNMLSPTHDLLEPVFG